MSNSIRRGDGILIGLRSSSISGANARFAVPEPNRLNIEYRGVSGSQVLAPWPSSESALRRSVPAAIL
ncbi:Uncharacterised protein [Mycobacterium tuberculosis]|nr:Uncharacterised protein [Mycobacterium tuberculosis]